MVFYLSFSLFKKTFLSAKNDDWNFEKKSLCATMCIRPSLPFGRHGAYTETLGTSRKKEKMTNRDIEIMLHFITRTEMYTFKDETGHIISFVTGYEIGRNGECDFSNQISKILEKEFKIKKLAMGWNGQIIEFGKKNDLNWETSFKMIGLKVLSKYFQKKSKKKYQEIIKSIIQ